MVTAQTTLHDKTVGR